MSQRLASQFLEEQFGSVYADVLFADEHLRVTCTRVVQSNAPLAYSVVHIQQEIANRYPQIGLSLEKGMMLGKAIAASGLPFERQEIALGRYNVTPLLGVLFSCSVETLAMVKKAILRIGEDNSEYASVYEFYAPIVVQKLHEHDIALAKEAQRVLGECAPFVITPLEEDEIDEFLRLAHGFLKKPMHVGIEDVEVFVVETRVTAHALLSDNAARVFTARDASGMLGYVSVNIHPALHLNGLECMVRELFVREECRLRGIGSSLMAYVERVAQRQGAKRISLATKWNDTQQQEFYASLGFARRYDFATKYLA